MASMGLSNTAVKVKLDKRDMTNVNMKAIGRTLELSQADGVEAGLFACNAPIFGSAQEWERWGTMAP